MSTVKRALVTGFTGQDGSYMAELLLSKGYEVHGMVRRGSASPLSRVAHILDRVRVVEADLADQSSLDPLFQEHRYDEAYNFAGQSFVPTPWDQTLPTCDVTGLGVARVLESIRRHSPKTRFYQASTSEMFGNVRESPQTEKTPFHPRSPYGLAKVYGHYAAAAYRESHGIFAVSGICFNHESPRRGMEFVTRKIAHGAARIKLGLDKELRMGNLDARRDWGFAGDYVEAMWRMLQQEEPEDMVIATGRTHTIKECLQAAFDEAGLRWEDHVVVDPKFVRPAEAQVLCGDPALARRRLGWEPKVSFEELIRMMVRADLEALRSA